MNVYDFDKTIYNGDSSIDFFFFCLLKKNLILHIPIIIISFIKYKFKRITKEELKSNFFRFVKKIDTPKYVKFFWKKNEKKIKKWYLNKKKNTDIIISASPEFLLKPITDKLKVNLIATIVDEKTGNLISKNCHGKEKVKRLKKFTKKEINEFYSDSLSDLPLKEISKKAYLVKKDKLINWD